MFQKLASFIYLWFLCCLLLSSWYILQINRRNWCRWIYTYKKHSTKEILSDWPNSLELSQKWRQFYRRRRNRRVHLYEVSKSKRYTNYTNENCCNAMNISSYLPLNSFQCCLILHIEVICMQSNQLIIALG